MGSGVSVACEIDGVHQQRQLQKIAKRKIVVVGAGVDDVNGIYSLLMDDDESLSNMEDGHRMKKNNVKGQKIPAPLIRNKAWVFKNKKGYQISREILDDESGWIIGKPPLAYYGTRNESLLCPSCIFKGGGEFLGQLPNPSVFDDLDKEFSPAELPSLPTKVKTRMTRPEPPPKLDKDLFDTSDEDEEGHDSNEDSFFAVSPVRQRKAWSTPTNNPLPKGNLFDELANEDKNEDKENVVNQFSHKKRKNNRYEYYKNRLKKNAIRKKHGSGLKERQNVIKKPKTPQRANPLDFI